MIKAVLFDLDGTFADTAPDLAAALNKVRADHKLPALPLETVRLETSNGANALIKLGFGLDQNNDRFDQLKNDLLDYYEQNIAENTRLFNGMQELLENFEKQQIRWGIVTNKPERFTLPLLEQMDISSRTDCIVSGDTTAHAKPHPQPLIYAAKLLDLDIAECLYVGDAERDIQAARNAGMRSLVAMFGYLGLNDEPENWAADGLIDQPQDILDYLT